MNLRDLNRHPLWKRPVRVFGHRFQAPTLDRLASLWLHKLGILGHSEIRLLRRLVSAGMTVVDVGANQGIYTLLLADLARPGPVFAFEPEPMLYQQLVANVRENNADNVVCHPIAISRSSGQLLLQPGKLHTGNNRIVQRPYSHVVPSVGPDLRADPGTRGRLGDATLPNTKDIIPVGPDLRAGRGTRGRLGDATLPNTKDIIPVGADLRADPEASPIEVTAASLDELFPDRRMDFLKMDVQGWEAEAFAGAKEVLRRNRDILLMFEFWPYGLRIAGTDPADLLRSLRHLGFNLWQIKNGALVALEKAALPDPSSRLAYCDLIGTRRTDLAAFGRGRSPS